MSIFGEIARGPDIAGTDYATREYVDEQLALRVLKTGDTMSGDLTMERGQVRGLPMDMNNRLQGDEAVSQFQVVEIISEAVRHFRKTRRPLVTIYAEENGPLKEREYEWSFGNGVSGGNNERGYPMATSGRLKYMSLAITSSSSRPSEARVNIVVNGVENRSYGIAKPQGQYSSFTEFQPPLALARGDMLNFRTASTNTEVSSAVVAAILELDLLLNLDSCNNCNSHHETGNSLSPPALSKWRQPRAIYIQSCQTKVPPRSVLPAAGDLSAS